MPKANTLSYFLWSKISEELLKTGFSESDLEAYRKGFLLEHPNRDERPQPGSICGYNLYFFGPSPARIKKDPEEAERARTVFAWAYKPENELLRKITHAIWDLLEDEISDETMEDTRIQL